MIQNLNKDIIKMEISGGKFLYGALIDSSSQIFVIYDGKKFVYIPMEHIRTFAIDSENEENIQQPTESPSIISKMNSTDLTIEKILSKAKDMTVGISVTGNQSLHGTITAIMDDYFVFQSPVYRTILISTNHLKWLVPDTADQMLYGLKKEQISTQSNESQSYANTFQGQIEQLKSKLVVINQGEKDTHIGKVENVSGKLVEIVLADSSSSFVNISHIKTIYQV